jgi:hypothetical protein
MRRTPCGGASTGQERRSEPGSRHVLGKVDSQDPLIKQAAGAAFRQWKSADPKHEIFREFIERERNNLLKKYRSDVHPLAEVAFAVAQRGLKDYWDVSSRLSPSAFLLLHNQIRRVWITN